ncbi:MAG: zonular occludens toxin domain-containing protein [Pseudomonadota bacterium]
MSIVLVTGTPGAGKTLWAVQQVCEKYLDQGRRIFHNIDGFAPPDPKGLVERIEDDEIENWPDYPEHSVFVFDECQRQFPRRNPMSQVPRYISGFETHRHQGMDFLLITQGPMLIDTHIHPLVERHVHLYRPFGLSRSSIFTWNTVNPTPNPRQSRITAQKRNFRFPKRYFGVYKSATQHTVERRIPWMLVLALPALAGLLGLAVLVTKATFGDMAGGGQLVEAVEGPQVVAAPPPPCLIVLRAVGARFWVSDGVSRFLLPSERVRELLAGRPLRDADGRSWGLCAA